MTETEENEVYVEEEYVKKRKRFFFSTSFASHFSLSDTKTELFLSIEDMLLAIYLAY